MSPSTVNLKNQTEPWVIISEKDARSAPISTAVSCNAEERSRCPNSGTCNASYPKTSLILLWPVCQAKLRYIECQPSYPIGKASYGPYLREPWHGTACMTSLVSLSFLFFSSPCLACLNIHTLLGTILLSPYPDVALLQAWLLHTLAGHGGSCRPLTLLHKSATGP